MCRLRATFIAAAGEMESSVLKNSAVASGALAPSPPVIGIQPSVSRAAHEFARPSLRFSVGAQVPIGTTSAFPVTATREEPESVVKTHRKCDFPLI
jgi:hypothetical protein